MSEVPPPETILSRHLELLSELHTLFLEEGSILRSTGGLPEGAFLERKRTFLARLDESLSGLRSLGGAQARLDAATATRVKDARNRLMQILMLDRENERMLLKVAVSSNLRKQFAPVLPGRVAKAYGGPPSSQKGPGNPPKGMDDSIRF